MRRFNISTNLDNCFHLQLKCKMQIQIREKLTNADANGARLAVKNFCAQTEIKTFPWRPRWAWPGGVVVRQITVGTYLSQLRYHVRFWSSPFVKIKNEIKLK